MKRIHLKRLLIVGLLLINQINLFSQNSLNFDGIDDNVTIPNGGELNNLQTATIEMWVKWNGTSQDIGANNCYGAILGRQKDNTFNNQVIGLDGADPNLSKILWKPYTYVINAITSSTSPNNDWIHLAITYTNGDHRMYINGILEGTSTLTGTIQN
ncbi:MAG: LamG domain-containing protein, partial [Aureibaculum sp.]|nr:LamG domain-containing protein [Aureibaculum sp.]